MAGIVTKGKKGFTPVEEGGVHTGTEAWNIAQYYTGYSIALPLKELNEYEDIARFGVIRMDEDLLMDDDQFNKRRAEAVKRYWQKLKQIVGDTMFKVISKDRKEAQEIHEYIKTLPKYFDALITNHSDAITHEDHLMINEEFLTIFMDKLVMVKEKYLVILDRTGLIFRTTDEVDLDKLTNEFIEGG